MDDYFSAVNCVSEMCRRFDLCICGPVDPEIFELQYRGSLAEAYVEKIKERLPHKPQVIEPLPEVRNLVGVESVYELTLTITKDDPYELRQYLQKIVDSKMFAVKGYKACIELTKAGLPHIHAILWSGKKYLNVDHIKSKIKYPYRFTLNRVRHQENYYNYILKEKDSPIIIEYCHRKGIDQFWKCPSDEIIEPQIIAADITEK